MTDIVDQAIEEAAQAVMRYVAGPSSPTEAGGDIPLALVPELIAALQGPAMRAVMAARVDQIARHGHVAENDDMLPIGWLPMEARQAFERARDRFNEGELAEARGLLIEGTAYGLAALDRLDRAMKSGERA